MKLRILTFFLLLLTFNLYTEEISWPETLTWGVAEWVDKGVSDEYLYLINSQPLRFLSFSSSCDNHQYSLEELESLAQQRIADELSSWLVKASNYRNELDSSFFDPNGTDRARESLNSQWREALDKVKELEEFPLELGEYPKSVSLVLNEKNSLNELLEPFTGLADDYITDVDFLVAGSMEEIEGILIFKIGIYSFIENKYVFSYQGAYLPEDSDNFYFESHKQLTEVLLGRPWGTLKIETNVPATIQVDGESLGYRYLELPFLELGFHKVTVFSPGFSVYNEDILIDGKEESFVKIELLQNEWIDLQVNSVPSGADIFVGSQWVGTTPWSGEVPTEFNRIILRKEGFRDVNRVVFPEPADDSQVIDAVLSTINFNLNGYITHERDDFYDSLGLFFVGLPMPFILRGIYNNTSQAYLNEVNNYGDTDEAERLSRWALGSWYGSMGALFIEGAFFVNMIINAVSYMDAVGLDTKE